MSDDKPDLAALAARGRELKAARAQAEEAGRAERRAQDDALGRVAVRLSFVRPGGNARAVGAIVASLALFPLLGWGLEGINGWLYGAAVLGLPLAALLALTLGVDAWLERRERAWVRARPFGLDADAYLDLLARERLSLRLEVAFVEPVPEADRARFAEAVRGLLEGQVQVGWARGGRALEVTLLDLTDAISGEYNDVWSNQRAHAIVRALVDRVLPAMHAARPVARLGVAAYSPPPEPAGPPLEEDEGEDPESDVDVEDEDVEDEDEPGEPA